MSNLNAEEKQKILNSVLGINNDDDFQSFKSTQIEPDIFDKVTDFFSRERGLERSKKLEDNIRYFLGPYAGSLGQANQLLNPIVGLQDAGEATREGRYVDAVTDTAAAALPIAGALAVKPLAKGVQSGIDEAVDAITEVMTGKSAGAVDLNKRKFITETPIVLAGAGAASSEAVSKGIGEVFSPLLKGATPFSKGLKNYNSLKAKQEILKKKMAKIMRPPNPVKTVEEARRLGFREIQRSMSDNIGELEKTFITEVAPYIDKKVLTELNNAELENLTEEFKSFNSGNLLRLLDPSIPTRSSDGKPLPKIKEVSNKMLDVREELLKRIQTTDNKSDWNIKAKTNAHKLIKEAFTIQNPRSQLDETSVMFDLAEENNLVKYSVDKDQKVSRELITGPELDQILEDYGLDKNGRPIDEKFFDFDEEFNKGGVVKKFNHGGDVPHADKPYLDGRAENIVKEFNEPVDEYLDTAIDLATEPLQEAKKIFMQAGKGAVFEMLPKDDPRIYQAFRQTNDYLAGLGYAGFKTGEAAAKFVAGSIADALGQDKGEIGYQILRDEKTAARDILGAGEAFAGMVGPRSIQILDDAIDAFGGYFQLLKTAGPVIKADLGGKLQALADGDFDFLKESSSPKTISAQVTGQGTTLVDQPDPKSLTKPKSLVSPLFKTVSSEKLTGYSSWGDTNPFYSSVEAAIENLPVGKEGIKGSNVIKYLTKKAPNINMRELYWSGMLEDAPMRGVEDYTISNTDQRGIDPNKIYTKEELKYIADVSMPQVMVRKFSSLNTVRELMPQWAGSQQVPINIFTLEPEMVATSRNTPTPPSILNRPNTNRQQTFRIGRGNFIGGQSPNSEYVEYLITNINPRGSVYPKADAHWRNKVDGKQENVLTHVRGSFIPIIYPTSTTRTTKGMVGKGKIERGYTTKNVFVVDEIQADPAQKRHFGGKTETSKVASQKTSKETADILNTPEIDSSELLTNNLISEVDNIGTQELIPTSDRFNRLFGVDENDAFPVQTNKVNAGLKEIAETLADVEKRFLANDLDADEVANIIRATFNNKLKTTAILRNTRGPNAFPEAVINQIKLNVLGDLIYGKGTVRANKVLKDNLTKVIENSIGGKPQPPTDITPVGIGDSVRLGLLAIMREAVKKDTNTIVIPPLDDIMKTHSLGEKPTKETYEDAMMKALRILRSETNKKVSFKKGKIKGLQFDSDKNYLIINFDSDIVDETKQTRFAEGGLV